MVRIGLYGIFGVYNFGCEAIVRGAYKFINKIYSDAQIMYFSYNYEYDRKALSDLDLVVVPIIKKASFTDKVIHKLKTIANSEKRGLYCDVDIILNQIDVVFSIGGDIYTIPKYIREKKKYPYYNQLIEFCDKAIGAGKDVVVYGASVGPFGEYKKAVDYYRKYMSKYKLIICREKEALDYLKNIGLTNVYFFPDPAFQVRGLKEIEDTTDNQKYIGINLSPLSFKEIYGNFDEDICMNLAKVIDEICRVTKKEMLFIPHVLSLNEDDNDLNFMQKIKKKMKPENQEKVHFSNYDSGFVGVKKCLKQCSIVISARMHCAINAIDENIPTIFLSYSQKSIGMCEFVYGSGEWVIDLKDIDTGLLQMVKKMIENRNEISAYLKAKNNEINLYYINNIENVKKSLNSYVNQEECL